MPLSSGSGWNVSLSLLLNTGKSANASESVQVAVQTPDSSFLLSFFSLSCFLLRLRLFDIFCREERKETLSGSSLRKLRIECVWIFLVLAAASQQRKRKRIRNRGAGRERERTEVTGGRAVSLFTCGLPCLSSRDAYKNTAQVMKLLVSLVKTRGSLPHRVCI